MRVAPLSAASTANKKNKEVKNMADMDKNVKTGVAAAAGIAGAQATALAAGITMPVTIPLWVLGLGGVSTLVLAYKAFVGKK